MLLHLRSRSQLISSVARRAVCCPAELQSPLPPRLPVGVSRKITRPPSPHRISTGPRDIAGAYRHPRRCRRFVSVAVYFPWCFIYTQQPVVDRVPRHGSIACLHYLEIPVSYTLLVHAPYPVGTYVPRNPPPAWHVHPQFRVSRAARPPPSRDRTHASRLDRVSTA